MEMLKYSEGLGIHINRSCLAQVAQKLFIVEMTVSQLIR